MISKELVELATIEVERLKKYAKAEELEKLFISKLKPKSVTECIYGLMVGNCFSRRANRLIMKCAVRSVVPDGIRALEVSCQLDTGFKTRLEHRGIFTNYFTPLEVYIAQNGADNKQIINYLKGLQDTLNLEDTIDC
jgi:hypothetical protein